MSSALLPELPKGGFNFENFNRNEFLYSKGMGMPKFQKTGTTIVGIIFKDGAILGADTRSTMGSLISEKNCQKIHYLAKNIYCCGAGTAADTFFSTSMIASQLEIHRLNTGKQVQVCVASRLLKQHLYRYQGHVSAALLIGGYDKNGPHIHSVHPHGNIDTLPYVTMGSGSLAAMAVFETGWKPDMTLAEGKKLVSDAIKAGIFNDLGSGSNVDLCVITKNGAEYLRSYEEANKKGIRQGDYKFKSGVTQILSQKTIPLVLESREVFIRALDDDAIVKRDEAMDTA